ncbi:hypothetical protein Trydic_g9749 [Trypoxylus dichotomus]
MDAGKSDTIPPTFFHIVDIAVTNAWIRYKTGITHRTRNTEATGIHRRNLLQIQNRVLALANLVDVDYMRTHQILSKKTQRKTLT